MEMLTLLKRLLSATVAAGLLLAPIALRAAEDLPVTDKIPAAPAKIRVMVYNGAYTSMPPRVSPTSRTRSMWSGSAGPGSITQAGELPTT